LAKSVNCEADLSTMLMTTVTMTAVVMTTATAVPATTPTRLPPKPPVYVQATVSALIWHVSNGQ